MIEEGNKRIKQEESLESYLKCFNNRELTLMSIFKVYASQDEDDLFKVYDLNHRFKKYIIDFIKPNVEEIWTSFFKIVPVEMLELFQHIANNNGLLEYTFDDFDVDLLTISMLKNYALAKVEYSKKQEKVKIFMPQEFCDAIHLCLKNKKIIEENKRNNEIFDYVNGLLEAYGMIEINKLYDIVKEESKINIEEFNQIIECKSMIDENIIFI